MGTGKGSDRHDSKHLVRPCSLVHPGQRSAWEVFGVEITNGEEGRTSDNNVLWCPLSRGSSDTASKWSPPQNYKKRVAALEAKKKPSTSQSQGITHKDQAIAERLARLRQENKPSEWGWAKGPKRHIARLRTELPLALTIPLLTNCRVSTLTSRDRGTPSRTEG